MESDSYELMQLETEKPPTFQGDPIEWDQFDGTVHIMEKPHCLPCPYKEPK